MKKLLSTIVLVIVATAGWAQTRIWNNIVTGYSNVPFVKITKVVLSADSTEVFMHFDMPERAAGQEGVLAAKSLLQADGKTYEAKNAVGMKLGQPVKIPKDCKVDFSLVFDALPASTWLFSISDPGMWIINAVRDADANADADVTPVGITDTYWRNTLTGDWLIGFAQHHVIYNNKVWDILNQTEQKDTYVLTLNDGLTIKVGKLKKGIRPITIGTGKAIACNPITQEALPDYPTKDTRKGFVDNGYREGDSVTIVGWLKDMPEQAWKQSGEFEVWTSNFITDKTESFTAKLDSLGRFTLRMPLLNSATVTLDPRQSWVHPVLEPGKTYFFLNDFNTGQKLFMGDDVRLQNELVACPATWPETRINPGESAMQFMERANKVFDAIITKMQADITHRPNLSQRYIDYIKGLCMAGQGNSMMQARFDVPGRSLPKEYMDYVNTKLWQPAPKPYTLDSNFPRFMRDYLDQLRDERHSVSVDPYTITLNNGAYPIILRQARADGKVSITDEELALMERYAVEIHKEYAKQAKNQKIDSLNIDLAGTDLDKLGIAEQYLAIMERPDVKKAIEQEISLIDLYYQKQAIESATTDQALIDLALARKFYWKLNSFRKSLDPSDLNFANKEIKLASALNFVLTENDKYVALEHQDLANAASLRPSTDVANMIDGEKMLRKIIEPYKGRVIYLDVWGTWCGPCKQKLKDSWKVKEALKDYDIVYLYLCNGSSDESWKNVIKEYNLTGPNCVHYNLPKEQQSAIEHYLSVNSFPTYKIIDKQGNIHDLGWLDDQNLEAFKQTMGKFCK